jgi:Flp pilus assembly protein TadD
MSNRDEKGSGRLEEAQRVAAEGDLALAARLLCKMSEEDSEDLRVLFSYAAVLFRLRRFAEAAPRFARILEDQPVNHRASLGLFHSLWQIDRKSDAAKEFRRFREAGGESMEYRRLIKDLQRYL